MHQLFKLSRITVLCWTLLIHFGCSTKPHVVHINSTPTGAMVMLNGRVVGETPFDISLTQRKNSYNIYIFRAIKEDFLPYRLAFKEQLYSDKVHDVVPKDIHFNLVRRQEYPIQITSDPTSAIILLNGEITCETPCTVGIKERIGNARTFNFIAVKEGFLRASKTIEEYDAPPPVPPFEFPPNLHFSLTPKPTE